MTSETEGREGMTVEPGAADGAVEITGAADGKADATTDTTTDTTTNATTAAAAGSTGTTAAVSTGMTAEIAVPATAQPATPTAEALDTPPPDGARIVGSLETIKTAVVWLVVIQILTLLSPLLRVSLKWSLIIGLVLMLGSLAVAVIAYLKAQSAQRNLPE